MQRHRDQHALAEMADRGHEDRPAREAPVFLRLRHVLVFEAQRVKLEGRAVIVVMRRDHRLAAARIAAHRVDGDRVIGGDQPGVDQRPDEADRPGRIAAGVGDPAGVGDALALAGRHLGKAVFPVRVDPVRGAGVEELWRRGAETVGQRRRFLGGGIRQAQDDEVDLRHDVASRGGVLAVRLRQTPQRDRRQRLEACTDADDPVVPASPSMNTLGLLVAIVLLQGQSSGYARKTAKNKRCDRKAAFAFFGTRLRRLQSSSPDGR